ncbi:MAG TPA: putative toxin-antitoxin system toxin component, PIN family [Promineifilum sp.]|nr:putative toxin-antitoxin system toxin component, PIN family [Promineifilum sp.]
MRTLIDTNVLISYLLLPGEEGAIKAIIRAFRDGRFTLLLPEMLLQELTATVESKLRLSRRISPSELASFTKGLATYGEKVDRLEEPFPGVTRDPKDDYLLAYALIARADYLVTGDKDLLSLQGQIADLEIVTPAQFVDIL